MSANSTVLGLGLSSLWCPSDGSVSTVDSAQARPSLGSCTDGGTNVWRFAHTSYGGNAGPYPAFPFQPAGIDAGFAAKVAQGIGVFNFYSNTTIGSITDGTSNTFLMGEKNFDKLPQNYKLVWMEWYSGAYSDTYFTTLFPMNSWKIFPASQTGVDSSMPGGGNPQTAAAGSNHPGGSNIAFADGSVHFIKDTIGTWPRQTSGAFPLLPTALTYNGPNLTATPLPYTPSGTVPVIQGVYQSLSTKAGGEVISADQY